MVRVEGKAGMVATVIAHSKSAVNGKEILTYELEYPRFIHAEFMTHRMFSRNSASSRAIPVNRMIELIQEKPATFVHWGKNQAGMQANEELDTLVKFGTGENSFRKTREGAWQYGLKYAIETAEAFDKAGYHKQIVNRLLEPFQMMKVVATATEWDNFFHLRNHKDAQPEIHELARVMLEAKRQSEPELLNPGEWHTPYVKHHRSAIRGLEYIVDYDGPLGYQQEVDFVLHSEGNYYQVLSLDEAIKVSCSCCAQVSYRRLDDSLNKALAIYDRLVTSEPVHASALEHVATPMPIFSPTDFLRGKVWEVEGITHEDREGKLWSGNFKSWIQYRQLVANHVCNEYEEGSN